MDVVHGLGRLDVPADRGIPTGLTAGSGQAAFCSVPPRGLEGIQGVLPVSRDGLRNRCPATVCGERRDERDRRWSCPTRPGNSPCRRPPETFGRGGDPQPFITVAGGPIAIADDFPCEESVSIATGGRHGKQATTGKIWSGRPDLNRRPLAPKASALPGCATYRRYEHGTLPEHSAGSQLLDNEPYRLPAVAEPVLLLGGMLGHRLPGAFDEKDRVVPEAARSARERHDLPFDAPRALRDYPGGKGRCRYADKCRGPRPGNMLHFFEKHDVVLLVGRLLARVPGGPYARSASQRVHRQAGVVRDAQDIAFLRVMERLDPRVLREGLPLFA